MGSFQTQQNDYDFVIFFHTFSNCLTKHMNGRQVCSVFFFRPGSIETCDYLRSFYEKKIRATIYFFLQLCFHETRLYDVMMQFNVVKCIATASSESAIKTNLWMFTMDVSIYIYPFKSKAYRANLQLMWCYYRHRTLAFPLDLCCCFQIR